MSTKKTTSVWAIGLISIYLSVGLSGQNMETGFVNTLTPAVPFITIPTLSSTQSLGYINSVGSNSLESGHFGNPAIMALSGKKMSIATGYTPWERELLPDMSLFGISAFSRISPGNYLGVDFTYFNLGHHTTIGGNSFNPYERLIAISYARKINSNSGIGIRVKHILSDLTGGQYVGGMESSSGVSLAMDMGYSLKIPGKVDPITHELGVGINNLGSKISYQENSDKDFIATTLNLGYAFQYQINQDQQVSIAYEFEKYLIPTPPIYYQDSIDLEGDPIIFKGFDPQVSVVKGLIQSFYDAPYGFSEEIDEIIHHFALNFSFKNLSLSSGLVLESETKGNRKFATVGVGFSLVKAEINLSYIIPFHQNSPFANTLGISAVIAI